MLPNTSKEHTITKYGGLSIKEHRKPPLNKQTSNISNISNLTTKPDNISEKISHYEKRLNKNQEDSIFEVLASRGHLDSFLEKQLNDYKILANTNDETKLTSENSLKISLLNEYGLVKKNNSISTKQIENLKFANDLKTKKIDILKNSIKSIRDKMNLQKEKEEKNSNNNKNLKLNKNDNANYSDNNEINLLKKVNIHFYFI